MSEPRDRPIVGQRWTSEAEPELGLGVITAVEGRAVTVVFPASDATRRYAIDTAPLGRARFHVGERVFGGDGASFVVDHVVERGGLLFYRGDGRVLAETDLSGRIVFSTPEARLLSGRTDPSAAFDVRLAALELNHRARSSPVRGFVGGRVDLVPHQLYIAHEVVSRYAPRILLADEVGLGKTIEAGLILHRLLVSGRIGRVLILVPESLLHQWLVELLRRFHLRFSLFDEGRCDAIASERPDGNPFLDDQLVLASIDFLASHPLRAKQAAAGEWDVLVVDEAHHLRWHPSGASDEYAVVEAIAATAEGLLLLTATPEQLGQEGHYARLRLLDPNRYPSLAGFLAEADHYQAVAATADRLLSEAPLTRDDGRRLRELLADGSPEREACVVAAETGDRDARERLVADLLDRSGIGRVLFRNTRSAVRGFPERTAHLTRLTAAPETRAAVLIELEPVAREAQLDLNHDPRIGWLAALLTDLGETKVLLICRSQATAVAIDAALQKHVRVRAAVFHEGLSLVQRDKNAAWFADPRGARILLCSEIGSEGRNFQFVHNLVLFDLPLDPDLLEQRIGRLDRIGQRETIHVHVPWIGDSAHEVLVAWQHHGLDAVEHSLRGGHHLLELLGDRAVGLARRFRGSAADRDELARLTSDARAGRAEVEARLRSGHDHLLELSSFRPGVAASIVDAIRAVDDSASVLDPSLRLFEHLGIYTEDLGHGLYRLNSEGLSHPGFPELDRGDTTFTVHRKRALERDDVQFLTWDHPLLVRAIETILGGSDGNSAFVRLPGAPAPIAVEAVFVLDCIAPIAAHLDRFLAPTPIRVVVDQQLRDVTVAYAEGLAAGRLEDEPEAPLLGGGALTRRVLPAMIARAKSLASERSRRLIDVALTEAGRTLGGEVERLRDLARVNPSVRADEIGRAEAVLAQAVQLIAAAGSRLDALRVIVA